MFEYYTVLSIVFVLALINVITKDNKIVSISMLFFVFIVMVVFIGLRWEIGSDWDVYLINYYYIHDVVYEKGYVFFESLFYSRDIPYSYFLLFITSFSLFFIFLFIFKRTDYALVSVLFFVANYMLSFMGGNRQILAIGIVFFSNIFIINRNPTKFILVILIASLFHVSSLIYFVAYFLYRPYFSFFVRYTMLLSAIFFGTYIAPIMLTYVFNIFSATGFGYVVDKLEAYQHVIFDNYSILSLVKKMVMLFIFDCCYRHVKRGAPEKFYQVDLFYNLFLFSIIFDALVGPINAAYMRASVYFRITEIILITYLLVTTKNLICRVLILFFILVLSSRQLYSALAFYPDLYDDYQNVLYNLY